MSSTGISSYTVWQVEAGERLDKFLTARAGITRSQLQQFIEQGQVLVNRSPAKPNYKVREGDTITVRLPEPPSETLVPEDIPLTILYADEHVVVVDKPAGMVVYPAAGHDRGTLMNALSYRFKNLCPIGAPMRPGVVHRLDRDTSGVMVVAISEQAYYSLVEQFEKKSTTRRYLALIYGNPKNDEGEVDAPIGRSVSDRKRMSTRTRRGKAALTHWRVLRRLAGASLIEARLDTGRTHQIRVHMASLGHPVLGDVTYGRKRELMAKGKRIVFKRQMLHARVLGFAHPATCEFMEFSSEIPEDMHKAMEQLGY
jgi:23S rRNA pseudouridine1911/1915/1917 synthase